MLGNSGVLADAGAVPQDAGRDGPGYSVGRLNIGEEGPNPPGGMTPGPLPVFAYGPGLVRCAEASVGIASAAIIATLLKRYLMFQVLRG